MNLALKYQFPIIPMHISAHNSWVYYVLYFLNQELRDMTLFRELFNKTNHHYRISIAAQLDPVELVESHGNDLEQITERLRKFVAEEMPLGAREFRPKS